MFYFKPRPQPTLIFFMIKVFYNYFNYIDSNLEPNIGAIQTYQ